MKAAIARHWRWFVLAAIPFDIVIAVLPHLTGDFTDVLPILPLRWVIMAVGAFALRDAHVSGAISSRTYGRAVLYLIFGFTAAGLLGGAMSPLPA